MFCLGLQEQEEARIKRDWEMKTQKETYEKTIKEYEDKISDMTLHIRTRDRQVMAVEEKVGTRHHKHHAHQ